MFIKGDIVKSRLVVRKKPDGTCEDLEGEVILVDREDKDVKVKYGKATAFVPWRETELVKGKPASQSALNELLLEEMKHMEIDYLEQTLIFHDDKIEVGCSYIPKKDALEIARRINKAYG